MADTFPKNTIDDNGLKKVWDMVMNRLGLKVDKEEGKGLSTNDYTTTEKNKLAGIANGAEVNTVTSVAGKTGAVTLDKSDVGLSNVGNFKAVSTSANQGLTDTEKSNARANIDTPSNGDIQSSKTVSGNPITVTDAAAINAEDITVDITPVQDLHGYDRPWAGGGWKNKAPTLSGAVISEGITVTPQPDGSVILDGTKSSTNNVIITSPFTVKANTTYTVSIGSMPSSISDFGIQGYGNSKTITPSYDYPSNGIQLMIDQGTVLSGVRLYPQVEIGSTPTSYAPYSNICPPKGRTGAELDRVVKNWFDKSNPQYPNKILNNDGGMTDHNGFDTWKFPKGHIYTFSCIKGSGFDAVRYGFESNGYITRYTTTNSTIVMDATNNDLYISIARDINFTSNEQLELGSTATAYEPYQGQQYTASFGETVYGGKWHVTEGGTDKTYGYATSTWGSMSNAVDRGNGITSKVLTLPSSGLFGGNTEGICNVLGAVAFNTSAYPHWFIAQDATSAVIFLPTDTSNDTVVQVVYKLTTPTTISTPKQNVPMLQGINTVYADCGDTQLKYQPDNVIGELKGEIQVANSFVAKMALRQGSGAKDFSYGGWSFRIRIFRSMGQISLYVENISASNVTEQAVVKGFNDESDYRAPEELRPNFNLLQAATYTTPSGWAIQVYLKDDGYIMFTGIAPEVGASAPTSSNWNLVEPWAAHQQAKDLFNN